MLFPTTLSKIRPTHLERQAFIYVRQSTLFQVREHPASTARQYDLAQRARDLGWPREHITIIDQDQGHSGASTAGRDGFQSLIVEVGLGHAGAVLSLEVSRLARSSTWRRRRRCAAPDASALRAAGKRSGSRVVAPEASRSSKASSSRAFSGSPPCSSSTK